MATLKIPINKSKSNDPGYRYMMRQISTISLGSGLTKFTNLDQISFDIKIHTCAENPGHCLCPPRGNNKTPDRPHWASYLPSR